MECHVSCAETAMHCLTMGGEHARPDHMKLLADCAAMCQHSMNFMLRDSAFSREICNLCADICDACDASCRSMHDERMTDCANVCRRCAAACREMSAHALTPAIKH